MTDSQTKDALRLYMAYKCDTREYRELAERCGINTAELTRRCWYWIRGQVAPHVEPAHA